MQTEERRLALLPAVATVAALVVIVTGALTLLGWILGVYFLAELVPDAPRMPANTAIALIALGLALWLVRDRECSDEARAWSRFISELVVIGAGLTLAQYIFGVDLAIDGLFTDTSGAMYPGRPDPHAATAILACGLWLAVLDRDGPRWSTVINTLAAVTGLIVLAAVIGYLFNVDYVYGRTVVNGVAPQTVFALVALWAGILCARPSSAWVRLLTSDRAGGHAMRRLVPAVIVITIGIGYALVVGESEDLFTVRVGAAFLIAIAIALLIGIVVYTSRDLDRADDENRQLQERLAELVERDPLTNVFNRRRLDEELRRQLAFAQRHGTRLAALSIDLDGFKATNDTHGHASGDELLMATAEVLIEELRESDFICRPGGDEFIVLLPDSDVESARIVAGKLIRSMRGVKRPKPGGGVIELRASIGISASDKGGWMAPHELLAAADRALYAAKQAGGDRFAIDEPLVLD